MCRLPAGTLAEAGQAEGSSHPEILFLRYRRIKKELSYWRSQSGAEVDFLIGDDIAIEVKATSRVNDKHLKGLRALKGKNLIGQFFLVFLDEVKRETPDGIRLLYW